MSSTTTTSEAPVAFQLDNEVIFRFEGSITSTNMVKFDKEFRASLGDLGIAGADTLQVTYSEGSIIATVTVPSGQDATKLQGLADTPAVLEVLQEEVAKAMEEYARFMQVVTPGLKVKQPIAEACAALDGCEVDVGGAQRGAECDRRGVRLLLAYKVVGPEPVAQIVVCLAVSRTQSE